VIAQHHGFTVAFYGGVLTRGTGKDLDLFFIEQDQDICSIEKCLQEIAAIPEVLRYGALVDHSNEITCAIFMKNGEHIDAHFRGFGKPSHR